MLPDDLASFSTKAGRKALSSAIYIAIITLTREQVQQDLPPLLEHLVKRRKGVQKVIKHAKSALKSKEPRIPFLNGGITGDMFKW